MTIEELEQELSFYPPNTKVYFAPDEEGNDIYESALVEEYGRAVCLFPCGFRVEE